MTSLFCGRAIGLSTPLHAANHFLDRDGGDPANWWRLGVFSLLAAAALTVRLRQLQLKTVAPISR